MKAVTVAAPVAADNHFVAPREHGSVASRSGRAGVAATADSWSAAMTSPAALRLRCVAWPGAGVPRSERLDASVD